jgi:hypothetical protein
MLWYEKCIAVDNQRIIQSTPATFSLKSRTMDRTERLQAFLMRVKTCKGLVLGGSFKQLKEALAIMSVAYTLR